MTHITVQSQFLGLSFAQQSHGANTMFNVKCSRFMTTIKAKLDQYYDLLWMMWNWNCRRQRHSLKSHLIRILRWRKSSCNKHGWIREQQLFRIIFKFGALISLPSLWHWKHTAENLRHCSNPQLLYCWRCLLEINGMCNEDETMYELVWCYHIIYANLIIEKRCVCAIRWALSIEHHNRNSSNSVRFG